MPVNSSVFFHFINIKLDEAINNEEGMNFSVFRNWKRKIFYNLFNKYLVYGLCKEKDIKRLENIIIPVFLIDLLVLENILILQHKNIMI